MPEKLIRSEVDDTSVEATAAENFDERVQGRRRRWKADASSAMYNGLGVYIAGNIV